MGIKESIKSVVTKLESVQCTNQDGNVVGLNVMIWADQRDEQPDMMVYAKPACFLETILSTGLPIGANALSYEVTFRVMIEQEQYNSEGNIDVELSLLDLKDSVHRALQNFKPLNCSPMYQSGRELDYVQSNRYLVVLEYSSHFVDLMSTELDPAMGYIVDTIDAPILSMEEELFVGTINDDVVPTYAVAGGGIVPIYSYGPSVWYNDIGLPKVGKGKNGDYYLNDSNGDVYNKVDGTWVLVANIKGQDGEGVSGGLTNVVVTLGMIVGGELIAEDGKCYILENGTLVSDINFNLGHLTIENNTCMFINRDISYVVSLSGSTAYYADERIATTIYKQEDCEFRFANGKIRVLRG